MRLPRRLLRSDVVPNMSTRIRVADGVWFTPARPAAPQRTRRRRPSRPVLVSSVAPPVPASPEAVEAFARQHDREQVFAVLAGSRVHPGLIGRALGHVTETLDEAVGVLRAAGLCPADVVVALSAGGGEAPHRVVSTLVASGLPLRTITADLRTHGWSAQEIDGLLAGGR